MSIAPLVLKAVKYAAPLSNVALNFAIEKSPKVAEYLFTKVCPLIEIRARKTPELVRNLNIIIKNMVEIASNNNSLKKQKKEIEKSDFISRLFLNIRLYFAEGDIKRKNNFAKDEIKCAKDRIKDLELPLNKKEIDMLVKGLEKVVK